MAIAALAGGSACGGNVVIDPEPGSTGSSGSGGDPTEGCESYCELRGATCQNSADEALCHDTCQQLAVPGARCVPEIRALFDCLDSQPVICNAIPAPCSAVVTAYTSCVGG